MPGRLNMRGVRRDIMLRDDMARLPAPTLFACGDRDAFAPSSSGYSLARQMPHARVEIIAGAGHMPQRDRPTLLLTPFGAPEGRRPGDAGT